MTTDLIETLCDWLGDNWDPDLTVGEWWDRLGMAGWSTPMLDVEPLGRGTSRGDALRVSATIAEDGALADTAGPSPHGVVIFDIVRSARNHCLKNPQFVARSQPRPSRDLGASASNAPSLPHHSLDRSDNHHRSARRSSTNVDDRHRRRHR